MAWSRLRFRPLPHARHPADAQGELQGVFASLNAIAMITSPLIMTTTFSHFSATDAPVFAPGAPFLLAAVLMLACIALHVLPRKRRQRHHASQFAMIAPHSHPTFLSGQVSHGGAGV